MINPTVLLGGPFDGYIDHAGDPGTSSVWVDKDGERIIVSHEEISDHRYWREDAEHYVYAGLKGAIDTRELVA